MALQEKWIYEPDSFTTVVNEPQNEPVCLNPTIIIPR
jgi:hypothetical protein